VTLHESILNGEITRRREETGAGAGIHVGEDAEAAAHR
jgi:hypothetical protein